jgi:hypothetical protein
MAAGVLTFVIVGQQDHPIYEVDLTGPKEVRRGGRRRGGRACGPWRPGWMLAHAASLCHTRRVPHSLFPPPPTVRQQQAQYLHQFVLHAALDAVDEAMWATKELYLKVAGGSQAWAGQQQRRPGSWPGRGAGCSARMLMTHCEPLTHPAALAPPAPRRRRWTASTTCSCPRS